MDPIASMIICAGLCPFWWWVAQAAEPFRAASDPKARALGRALYRAAFVTAAVLALIAMSGAAKLVGGVDQVEEVGLL